MVSTLDMHPICILTTVRSVQVMSTLPLKALSRLWGRFNEIDIPYYLRVPGFKLYSFIFGVK
jgi:phosphatidylserine decarboxylase